MIENKITKTIFLGFLFGIIAGIITSFISDFYKDLSIYIISFYKFGGDIFLKILKMLVVPIVFFSLVSGVANLNNISSLGRIGIKTISLYIFTTLTAITISLTVGTFLDPGSSVSATYNESNVSLNHHPQSRQFFKYYTRKSIQIFG